jgi:hypothetical protein
MNETDRDKSRQNWGKSEQNETTYGIERTTRTARHAGGISPETPVVEHKGIVEPVAHFFILTGAPIIASVVRQIPGRVRPAFDGADFMKNLGFRCSESALADPLLLGGLFSAKRRSTGSERENRGPAINRASVEDQ